LPCRACRHRLTSANNDDLVLAGTQRCGVSRGKSSSVEESRSHYRGAELDLLLNQNYLYARPIAHETLRVYIVGRSDECIVSS